MIDPSQSAEATVIGSPSGWHMASVHDLIFPDYALVPCRYASGRITLTWTPLGMPRFDPKLERSTFFLFARDPKTGEISDAPDGAGFIVSRRWENAPSRFHFYAVTNWHVAVKCGASILRINTLDGKSRMVETEPHEWYFATPGNDLAVYDITEQLINDGLNRDILTYINEDIFAMEGFIFEHDIGMGDDVFMIGLFVDHPGNERNEPIGRFGNIARLSSGASLVEQPNGQKMPSHLVDMRSRGGFSGSPVFIYRVPFTQLKSVDGVTWTAPVDPTDLFCMLLGVHCAQFPEEVRFEIAESKRKHIEEGDLLKVPSSITVVVPAWEISRLMDDEKFARTRVEREAQHADKVRRIAVPE